MVCQEEAWWAVTRRDAARRVEAENQECRDEVQQRGEQWRVRRCEYMDYGLAGRSTRAHNCLTARPTDCLSAFLADRSPARSFLPLPRRLARRTTCRLTVPSARRWLAQRLAR